MCEEEEIEEKTGMEKFEGKQVTASEIEKGQVIETVWGRKHEIIKTGNVFVLEDEKSHRRERWRPIDIERSLEEGYARLID